MVRKSGKRERGYIRLAQKEDVSRIAEMIVVNYRMNFFPILKNESFYFKELNVLAVASEFNETVLRHTYVYDDGVVKGMMYVNGEELVKLYVEPHFQSQSIGAKLLQFALEQLQVTWLWALQYNKRGISFYEKNGFVLTGEKMLEDGWIPLVKLRKK